MKLRVHGNLNMHLKITLVHQLDLEPKEVLEYYNHAIAICEAYMQRLKEELVEAKSHLAQVVLHGILEVVDKAKSMKTMINEWNSENLKTFPNIDKFLFTKEDQEDLVVALNVEIKEIEESLVDIKKMASFDCFWSSQLCQ
jgi:molecular chaperone GrpE (heat shock protein)